MKRLTAEQRYRQARQKARMIWQRNLRAFLEDRAPTSGPPLVDLERACLIAELERALASANPVANRIL